MSGVLARSARSRRWGAAILLAAGCAACGSGNAPAPTAATSAGSASAGPASVSERCRVELSTPGDGAIERVPVTGGGSLRVARLGSGSTVAVLLPQSSGGMCGALSYAVWLAGHGVRVLAADTCWTAGTQCDPALGDDPTRQVTALVDHARSRHRATHVVVIGASAGGATALAVAQAAKADAVVDLSGPAAWPGVTDAEESASATTIPLLVVCADSDTDVKPARLRAAVAASPAKVKRYLVAPSGHGWSMVTDGVAVDPEVTRVGRQVLSWVRSVVA